MTRMRKLISAALGLLAMLFLLSAPGALADERQWAATGAAQDVVAADCTDCGDDVGMIIACRGANAPAEVTVNWAAVDTGQAGAVGPITFAINGRSFTYQAVDTYFGAIGYTPVFRIQPRDPLLAALASGQQADVSFGGRTTRIGLYGAYDALVSFVTQCGWARQGAATAAPARRYPSAGFAGGQPAPTPPGPGGFPAVAPNGAPPQIAAGSPPAVVAFTCTDGSALAVTFGTSEGGPVAGVSLNGGQMVMLAQMASPGQYSNGQAALQANSSGAALMTGGRVYTCRPK